MAKGWRMWSISLLTIMLLTLLSAVPIDITDDIKKVDAKADNDAMHSHDENVTRGGKLFGHNQFDLGNIDVPGSVAGDDVSIGHKVNIDVQGHTHDHHHHEADTEIECKGGLREIFKSIDSNKDGLMDAMELLRVCHQNNIHITKPLAVRILTLPDKTVEFNMAKFCELLKDCPSTNSADSIYFLLQLFDKGIIVDGGWSAWSSWNDCTGTCEEATKTRTRACSSTAGDKSCPGAATETESCDLPSCEVCNPGPYPLLADCFCKNTNGGGVPCPRRSKCDDGVCQPPVRKYPCSFDDTQLDLPPPPSKGSAASPHKKHWTKWTDNVVPYFYGNKNTKLEDKEFIRKVMDIIQSKTCYQFKPINEVEYGTKPRLEIDIDHRIDCTLSTAYVEKLDYNRVKLKLSAHVTMSDGSDCSNTGLLIHEMMHALGVGHTQRRSDRNSHISVEFANIHKNYQEQYRICDDCKLYKQIPYDCGSIMHYGTHDNGIDGKQTIVPKSEKCKLDESALLWKIQDAMDVPAKDWELLNIIGSKECTVCAQNAVNPADAVNPVSCFCKSPAEEGAVCTPGKRCNADGTCSDVCTANAINSAACFCESSTGGGEYCTAGQRCTAGNCQSGSCSGTASDWNCCSSTSPCKENEGDCDTDDDCVGSLVCGKDNCRSINPLAHHSADCCIQPGMRHKRSVQEIATVRGKIILPTGLDFTFPEDSHIHISCDDNSKFPSTSLGGAEMDVSNKSSQEEIHYELEADLSNSEDISISATINVGWESDPIGDEWIRKGDFTNEISHHFYVTEDTSEYQMDIAVVYYN